MRPQTPGFEALEERLERVEPEDRRLKQAGGVVLALAAAALLLSQVLPARRIVETGKFVFEDGRGLVRATLAVSEADWQARTFMSRPGTFGPR